LAVGFKPEKTIVVDDLRHIDYLYQLAVSVARKVTFSTARATFGFTGETNIGMIFYMAIQAAPCFLGYIIDNSYANCLIPAAIDQDPYWRVTRDIELSLVPM
jgi:tryptophanyl-tRNA synthetase